MLHPILMRLRLLLPLVLAATRLGILAPVLLAADAPGRASEKDATNAAFREHLAKLRKTAPKEFTIVVEAPFIVLGDDSEDMVKYYAAHTVKWAVDRLKQDYFKADPAEIIDIWLFKDEDSYRKHAKLLFGDTPETKFGYYSAPDHALVMNISTGTGTLVHEIVHPFMHANFPACPPWFDEGLASLYEQSTENNGHIWGLV